MRGIIPPILSAASDDGSLFLRVLANYQFEFLPQASDVLSRSRPFAL